ncbi:NmrA family NAD(P)-binding protein [Paraburkholderia acidicola]|uniref:NmrA family NAD(P)-binding protein n=1 Tax=Paraburkholderia acidicola TaxID=1912599 RepID=A0ABV1LW27_9BURK
MFAITGIVDPVGGVVARVLLAAGLDVRGVVDQAVKGVEWADQGCEVAVAEMNDADALLRAFRRVEGIFVLLAPNFDPVPGSPESTVSIAALKHALTSAMPKRVVFLSMIGVHATQPDLLRQLGAMEREFDSLPMPVAFLRAAWFMENAASDIASALVSGVIPSFLFPLDKPVPMVAIADVGRMAAHLLRQNWMGKKLVELEGPHRTSPNDVAEVFSRLLGLDIRMEAVARDRWAEVFASQGMKNPLLRIQMLDGLNEGWIDFEFPTRTVKGSVPLEVVVRGLIHHTFETV